MAQGTKEINRRLLDGTRQETTNQCRDENIAGTNFTATTAQCITYCKRFFFPTNESTSMACLRSYGLHGSIFIVVVVVGQINHEMHLKRAGNLYEIEL